VYVATHSRSSIRPFIPPSAPAAPQPARRGESGRQMDAGAEFVAGVAGGAANVVTVRTVATITTPPSHRTPCPALPPSYRDGWMAP